MRLGLYTITSIYINVDINKIIEDSKNVGTEDLPENEISTEIMRISKLIFDQNPEMHPWYRGVDMIEKLRHLGKSNVRTHLERLAEKDQLETKLHGTKKVYRLRVIKDD